MKNLKKYMALLAAMLLVLSFAACAPVADPTEAPAAQSQKPTETPTNEMPTEPSIGEDPTEEVDVTEGTEEVTEPSADYSAYMGQWYSGSVTLNIEAENKWNMTQNGEAFLMGQIVVNEEDGSLQLYDVEGTEAAKILKDGETSLYAELYMEELYNRIEDFFFSREQSDVEVGVEIEDVVDDEEPVSGGDDDEIIAED